jgi:hypothetical protein
MISGYNQQRSESVCHDDVSCIGRFAQAGEIPRETEDEGCIMQPYDLSFGQGRPPAPVAQFQADG